MGRTIVTLLVMLVTFAAFAVFFVALDSASGMRLRMPAPFAAAATTRTPLKSTATRTPSTAPPTATLARPTFTPGAASTAMTSNATSTVTTPISETPLAATSVGATPTATPSAAAATSTPSPPAVSATPMPTPPGGITPPRYGTLPNYPNGTSFSPDFMQTLDGQIITLTNQQRAKHGLTTLDENGALDVIAAARSEDLIQRNYFDHYDPTGPLDAQGHHPAAVQELLTRNGITYTEVGENLIGRKGFPLDSTTPAQVVQAWMTHPEHRANILHPSYTMIGVGMAAQNETDGLHVIITQVFLR